MFRKLVSNLPFSPALVGQISFYSKRLRKEETTRRIGLFMTALALIVQSFTVFVPATSANTSHESDLIKGGVSSMSELLDRYDNPNYDYKKIMTYAGITRSEIANAKKTSVNSRDYGTDSNAWLSWGRVSRMSAAKGEVKHVIDDSTTVYSRPLWRLDTTEWTTVHGSTYEAFLGSSAKMGKFAILINCGNLVTRKVPPAPVKITVCRPGTGIIDIFDTDKRSTDLPATSDQCQPKISVCRPGTGIISIFESEKKSTDLPANSDKCKTCPGNPSLPYDSPDCSEIIVESKTATNLTQGGNDATKVTAVAGDRIEYRITITNPGKVPASATFLDGLDDVLEYSSLQDNGGGSFDQTKKSLTWPSIKLAAGEKQTRTFVVALPNTIPTTARGESEPTSYDCIMNNTFGDNIQIRIGCEAPKVVEQTISELPQTGPTENMIFAGGLLAVVSFFWARSKQLGKEIRLVRKDFSASTI